MSHVPGRPVTGAGASEHATPAKSLHRGSYLGSSEAEESSQDSLRSIDSRRRVARDEAFDRGRA